MEREHNVAVMKLTPEQARAIVLSIRTLLSFDNEKAVDYQSVYDIAYMKDNATRMFLAALECD